MVQTWILCLSIGLPATAILASVALVCLLHSARPVVSSVSNPQPERSVFRDPWHSMSQKVEIHLLRRKEGKERFSTDITQCYVDRYQAIRPKRPSQRRREQNNRQERREQFLLQPNPGPDTYPERLSCGSLEDLCGNLNAGHLPGMTLCNEEGMVEEQTFLSISSVRQFSRGPTNSMQPGTLDIEGEFVGTGMFDSPDTGRLSTIREEMSLEPSNTRCSGQDLSLQREVRSWSQSSEAVADDLLHRSSRVFSIGSSLYDYV